MRSLLIIVVIFISVVAQSTPAPDPNNNEECLPLLTSVARFRFKPISQRADNWNRRLGVVLASVVKLNEDEINGGHRARMKKIVQFIANQDLTAFHKSDLFLAFVDTFKNIDEFFYAKAFQDVSGSYVFQGFSIVNNKNPTVVITSDGSVYLGLHSQIMSDSLVSTIPTVSIVGLELIRPQK